MPITNGSIRGGIRTSMHAIASGVARRLARAAVGVLFAGLLDEPLPDCLPDRAAGWI
ncbi:hypothetical protein [Bradyrhizobium sp. B120]|uniref:hypothetical protein n=1 Tax=Bradyrhizobium sp. B120 TaxID=3410088 RepID=UPI003B97D12A